MRRLVVLAAMLVAVVPAAAFAEDPKWSEFTYARELRGDAGAPIRFEPDGPLFAHSRIGFADLRIKGADGSEVPWRRAPERGVADPVSAEVLNSGRQGELAVALLDLGPERLVRDRIELDISQQKFVGNVTVFGSDDRQTFTRLGSTAIYSIDGADERARSTTVVFSPSDFRYLQLRATGIKAIAGATVSGEAPEQLLDRELTVSRADRENTTELVLDLRYGRLPVDELRIASTTKRYDRNLEFDVSTDRKLWTPHTFSRIVHFPGSVEAPLEVDTRHRYIRIRIMNEDDEPLRAIEVEAFARSRSLLAEEGHPQPYTVYYGDRDLRAPRYDFAKLPASAFERPAPVNGTLGAEAKNPEFEDPGDTRSFVARHPNVINGVLGLAALALGIAAFLALRRRSA